MHLKLRNYFELLQFAINSVLASNIYDNLKFSPSTFAITFFYNCAAMPLEQIPNSLHNQHVLLYVIIFLHVSQAEALSISAINFCEYFYHHMFMNLYNGISLLCTY